MLKPLWCPILYDDGQGVLLVNQSGSRFSMILLDNGLFLNSTREEAQQHIVNNYSLYVYI